MRPHACIPRPRTLLITADGGGSNGSRFGFGNWSCSDWPTKQGCAYRLSLSARHQQMEQDRASPVLAHHHELAGPAPW